MATMTPKELALELDTDPRTVRKFLRADRREQGLPTPGKGHRWGIERKELRSLRKKFEAWVATPAPAEDEVEVDLPDED